MDVSKLPSGIARRASRIAKQLEKGVPYHELGGHRLKRDRSTVTVPVGRKYRIICSCDSGVARPIRVVSHEKYNKLIRQ